jgi:hypothetical protein
VLSAICGDADLVDRFWDAAGRAAVERNRQDEAAAAEAAEGRRRAAAAAAAAGDPAEWARLAAAAAMTAGQSVACPRCGAPARKDERCMHMHCGCGANFCYVCGGDRGVAGPACECDSPSPNLEMHPGWGGFGRADRGETPAAGALAEFHRRRVARLLRVAAEAVGPEAWAALRRREPELLADVVDGRGVGWDELRAAEHPSCGPGRARSSWGPLEARLREEWALRPPIAMLATVMSRRPA